MLDKLMYDNSPHGLGPPVSERTTGTFDTKTGTVSFIDGETNYFHDVKIPKDPLTGKACVIRGLYVHNGEVWNAGEDDLSEICLHNASTLEEVYYCPNDTKGGTMIRPNYCKGDRSTPLLFPVLEKVTINCDGLKTLLRTWICPNLVTLEIAYARMVHFEDRWLFELVRSVYPKLHTLRIFVKATGEDVVVLRAPEDI